MEPDRNAPIKCEKRKPLPVVFQDHLSISVASGLQSKTKKYAFFDLALRMEETASRYGGQMGITRYSWRLGEGLKFFTVKTGLLRVLHRDSEMLGSCEHYNEHSEFLH
jgi:hypothetical protein